jgi:hypothetical protein
MNQNSTFKTKLYFHYIQILGQKESLNQRIHMHVGSSGSSNGTVTEALRLTQLLKKFLAFYGAKRSSPCSPQPATGPCPEPNKSSSHPKTPLL